MDLFDCFCGIGAWQKRDRLLPFAPADIAALMDHFGIRRALVHSNFTTGGGSPLRGNRALDEACAADERFVPAFTFPMYPYDDCPTVEQTLADMRAAGAGAVWHAARKDGFFPLWLYGPALEACVQHRLPFLAHRDALPPDIIDGILCSFPALRMILVGARYDEDWWLYPLLRRHAGLHVCLGHAYVVVDNPMRFIRHFGAERLLFGSGLPQFSPGGLITHVMYARISDEDRARIFGGNLARLLAEVRL
jgi:predicted TIM-barrel fold metal-dependent hydrolase